ncbi:sigma-54-dependent Fis family transcriptional regulator [Pseudomonas aeruginosa]|uniref:sigma-54-dependent Fis family transcriptional regulator n=3 Tax=Pseudomonas aeruginosa TaxID=287 RepID=UPI0021F16105|nr:sigma-54-dependent Fis family transcriptional regulator [Pseudomonas aeruginosa]MCV4102745.1 sigma-54-dependent Fis family transcriptional regulator [Pseudomonas aeruginosa]
MPASSMSRHARQVLTVAQGKIPPGGPATDPSIARSWLRCLEQHHLDPGQPMAPMVLEHARMLERRERLQQVLEIADGEMHSLYQQLSGNDHAVLLTDARGVILNCVNADAQRQTFEHAGLWLGADWSEPCEGTNGIGTCVVERQALTIQQEEHFRSRHTGLTCSASPVFDPQGELMAVLDVSSARQEVSRQSQFHTMALVNLSAKIIEGCYFLRRFEGSWLLRFHVQGDYVGLFSEGLLAFEEDGRIRAVNQSALNLLGCPRQRLLGQPVETFFDCRLDDLLGRASPQPSASWPLRTREGRTLYAMLRGAPRAIPQALAVPTAAKPAPAAPGLCLGDAELAADFRRALKVYARDVPLLLNGETGSGKEAFAKAVHLAGPRAEQAFVALNCAAIPETLIESELFGYRGGSFTGARKEGMRGKLQQADGGTLFLDEIGDMPLALQTRLLRVLEERRVVPLGGEPEDVDVRLISATHRDLAGLVADGRFREDLYYRLNGMVVSLPPRRAPPPPPGRRGNKEAPAGPGPPPPPPPAGGGGGACGRSRAHHTTPHLGWAARRPPRRARRHREELLDYLLAEEARGQRIQLDGEVRQGLLAYRWPGNVRQMRTVLRTLVALCEDGRVGLRDLPADIRQALAALPPAAAAPAPAAGNSLDDAERAALLAALDGQRWHVSRVAEQLGISRNTLYRKLRRHGLVRGQA